VGKKQKVRATTLKNVSQHASSTYSVVTTKVTQHKNSWNIVYLLFLPFHLDLCNPSNKLGRLPTDFYILSPEFLHSIHPQLILLLLALLSSFFDHPCFSF
jgi:hypothetical protein